MKNHKKHKVCVFCETYNILDRVDTLKTEFNLILNQANQKIDHDIKMYVSALTNSIQNMKVNMLEAQEENFKRYLAKIKKNETKKSKKKIISKKRKKNNETN